MNREPTIMTVTTKIITFRRLGSNMLVAAHAQACSGACMRASAPSPGDSGGELQDIITEKMQQSAWAHGTQGDRES
jgi:hypothetical protein